MGQGSGHVAKDRLASVCRAPSRPPGVAPWARLQCPRSPAIFPAYCRGSAPRCASRARPRPVGKSPRGVKRKRRRDARCVTPPCPAHPGNMLRQTRSPIGPKASYRPRENACCAISRRPPPRPPPADAASCRVPGKTGEALAKRAVLAAFGDQGPKPVENPSRTRSVRTPLAFRVIGEIDFRSRLIPVSLSVKTISACCLSRTPGGLSRRRH